MELFGSNIFSGMFHKREAAPQPIAATPGVPTSTTPPETQKVTGGNYQERISYVSGPESALVVGAVPQQGQSQ